ncbi:MAG: transcription elongation factor GreB [Candidatus Endonucleobacter bathymodioli]|uniref:Transcription elongation factor GreB n=1 Tax=Candidatus Endonucleibacter bathymodioli TaxID=539814 RepID=A0AA90SRX9_9GAMM|nr:transcription elongation factor GreB [Candidatus Endonucleobacter bathymodioli]
MYSTPLITNKGKNKLEKELSYLWSNKRPIITQAVSDAAALGDRSENAEYKEGKRLLREIDRRIRHLRKRLDVLKVVNYSEEQEGKVYFGAWVELINDQNKTLRCRIVGPDEIDTRNTHISIDSPMAKAMLGKQENEEINVQTPSGGKTWVINVIQYQSFKNDE